MSERELLFRLIKDDKIVGYERHDFGQIYHGVDLNVEAMNTCYACNKIAYQYKEQYWKELKPGVMLFDGDELVTSNDDPAYDVWDRGVWGKTTIQVEDNNFEFSDWGVDFEITNTVFTPRFVTNLGRNND